MLRLCSKYHTLSSPIASRIGGSTKRFYADFKMTRPGPPPLPAEEQAEFEKLQAEAEKRARVLNRHSAAPENNNEFEGNVNPVTGEVGGPKQDPLRHGDYSFNGRVTDF